MQCDKIQLVFLKVSSGWSQSALKQGAGACGAVKWEAAWVGVSRRSHSIFVVNACNCHLAGSAHTPQKM